MTNYDALFECLINSKHTLLGIDLTPFCLLHLLWLTHIESPFIETANNITLADVELAAIICSSSTSEQILERIQERKLSLLKKIKSVLWRRRNKQRDLRQEVLAFLDYQNDYLALPRFQSRPETEEHNEVIPWFYSIACHIMKETGWSEQTVLTMPLGKLHWLSLALVYQATGETNIKSDKEAFIEQVLTEQK